MKATAVLKLLAALLVFVGILVGCVTALLIGPGINAWMQRSIGGLNFIFRILLTVLICVIDYGLTMVLITPLLVQGLVHFNNYTLTSALFFVFLIVGILADRN